MNHLAVLRVVCIAMLINCQLEKVENLEICVTESNKKCMCSNDGRIILCNNARIQKFPTFNSFFMKNVEELHLAHNNVSAWPNNTVWQAYLKLNYIDVTRNPICTLPVVSKHIDVDISPCKYRNILLHFFKYNQST